MEYLEIRGVRRSRYHGGLAPAGWLVLVADRAGLRLRKVWRRRDSVVIPWSAVTRVGIYITPEGFSERLAQRPGPGAVKVRLGVEAGGATYGLVMPEASARRLEGLVRIVTPSFVTQPDPAVDVDERQIETSLRQLADRAADPDLTLDGLKERWWAAGRAYVSSGFFDSASSTPVRVVIDWSIRVRGEQPNVPVPAVGNDMLAWVTDGYIVGLVLYGTAMQMHACPVRSLTLSAFTRAVVRREDWQPGGVWDEFVDWMVFASFHSKLDRQITEPMGRDLLGAGLAIAIAHHACHGAGRCSAWRDGADHDSDTLR